jgi:hypothetical protein
MSRAPHQTLAHLIREELRGLPNCRGNCQQGRRACAAPKACRTFVDEHASALYTSLHRVTPAKPEPEENGLLAFLDGWLTNLHMLAIGGITAGLVVGAFLIVYILTNYLDFVALVARMHTP